MARANFNGKSFSCALREGNRNEGRIFENHCHPEYELIAVLEGNVSVVIEGRKSTLRHGEAAIIPPLCYHSIYTDGKGDYKRVTALFAEELIPREMAEDFLAKTRSSLVISHRSLSPILSSLHETMLEGEIAKYESLIESCIVQILYLHTYRTSRSCEGETHPRVKLITEYIDSHITEKITLDDISQELFVSKSTLCHIFRDEMKISVKQYIIQKKLSYAARLIGEGASTASAASAIGYENYANFYKVYKKTFGSSPRSIRSK